MADQANTPVVQLFQAAANPAPSASGNSDWDKRFARFLVLDGLADSDRSFGATDKAHEQFEVTRTMLKEAYGKDYLLNPKGRAEANRAHDLLHAAEEVQAEQFLAPLWQAVRDLVLTPAPNLPAALFKIALIKREDLAADPKMTRDAMDIVVEDMASISQT